VGLELVITWINRILFLKLLEAQLIRYNRGDLSYSFLNLIKIKSYDDLNSLFFQVLACKFEERSANLLEKWGYIPYLNSSLFDVTNLEHQTIVISNLTEESLPVFKATVLKDSNGKKLQGQLNSLEYLFNFLSAYNFSSDSNLEIQEENKSLINASVLGLIFEKINGYKDGSFFTPGFITMYMCRELLEGQLFKSLMILKGGNVKILMI
jgi:adenine-specific DNA-methyltransferase